MNKKTKSRSDETLITVDFNLRSRNKTHPPKVPQGRHYVELGSVVPAGLESKDRFVHIRRLRFASPTVNKVLSHAGQFVLQNKVFDDIC